MKKIRILILVLLAFLEISLVSLEQVVAKEDCKYYSKKFEEIQKQIDEEHRDNDGNKVDGLKNLVVSLRNDISYMSQKTKWNTTASENFKKCIKAYFKINRVYKDCSHNFRELSYKYNGWKNEKVDPTDENDDAERNKNKYASDVVNVDIIQNKINDELNYYKSEISEIFFMLSGNMKVVVHEQQILDSENTSDGVHATQLLAFVANFCVLGGSIWMILGTITLAGSLKDKNGPTLQTSIWQIIGGTMIVFATYLFKNSSQYPNLLNDVLWLASQFTRVGGALWSAWGVIILAGAIKDKTGPALQSAIWQIVGGIMIIMTSYLFTYVVKVA